jgi:hypothetical protein
MATAAAYWMASASQQDWSAIGERATMMNAARLRSAWAGGSLPSGRSVDEIAKTMNGRMAMPSGAAGTATGSGYHRLQTVPLDNKTLFAQMPTADDQRWWDEQDARFAARRDELLPSKPTIDLLAWETLNLMDGHRSTAEIADIMSAEFAANIDQAWVERMAGILEKKQLVAK